MIYDCTDSGIIGSENEKLVINNILKNNLIKVIDIGGSGGIDSR